ncbi:MAG TPA: protein translocase subunit SecD [Candidatus Sulfopaludibacter sp.]|nr:protein translocase subunit SecD [Candidatus Sulfopaludibacter sp.]
MKNNDFWKFILVAFIICWSLYETYPPTSRDLVNEFKTRAVNRDKTFADILTRLEPLQKARPDREFANLEEAIGTNDIQDYFKFIDAKAQLHPTTFILNQLQRDASGKIKLGLDLQGGTSFLVQMDTSKLETTETRTNSSTGQVTIVTNVPDVSGALSQAVEVLRKRVDAFGVAEPVIQAAGGDSILIQLPGLSEDVKERAKEQIQKAAYLEFRMVREDSQQIIDNHLPIPPGYELLKHIEPQPNGQPPKIEQAVVKKRPEDGLAGDIVKNAMVVRGNMGEPEIDFTLNENGAKKFADVTRNNIGRQLAIVLDGELQSAPVIQSAIETGNGQITGHFTPEEAQSLASVLQNPLRAPLKIIYSSDVDPTLGKDSIRSGIRASIAAVVFVSAFMLVYYWIAGLTANIALVTNIIILFGVMCSIGTTWTLPGIAGMVLTIGMAVDANVLIYERLREEIAKGKSLRGAIAAGYARAFGTIFDSHVTTLISSVILIFMGTGEIKGFGVTLTIGVAASLFTALVVTRLIFNFLLDRNWLKSLPMLHVIRSTQVNFMKAATPLFIITWAFVILSLGYGALGRGEKLFGVDFLGGDSTTFSFQQKIGVDQIREAMTAIGEKDAQIQYQKDASGGGESLRVTTSSGSEQKVEQALAQQFPQAHFVAKMRQQVGATVGAQIRQSAVIACLLSMFGILLYVAFRYEFSFAVGAIVGVLHDVLLAIGCYCIANAVSGRQFNATVVAALLTIIGFSLNDKVVIFDRIRENLKLGVRGTFREVINQALNQTLSRTIITSGTVLIATLCLFIWGGGVINDFAFTFLVGIITGTYSSIYIASAFVLWWHKGNRPDIGGSQVAVQSAESVKA